MRIDRIVVVALGIGVWTPACVTPAGQPQGQPPSSAARPRPRLQPRLRLRPRLRPRPRAADPACKPLKRYRGADPYSLQGVEYPVAFANHQRNSHVQVCTNARGVRAWSRKLATNQPSHEGPGFRPAKVLLNRGYVGVVEHDYSKLTVYDSKTGKLKHFTSVQDSNGPHVFTHSRIIYNGQFWVQVKTYANKRVNIPNVPCGLGGHSRACRLFQVVKDRFLWAASKVSMKRRGRRFSFSVALMRVKKVANQPTGRVRFSWSLREQKGVIIAALPSKDEKRLVIVPSDSKPVLVLDPKSGKKRARFLSGFDSIHTAALSPDDRLVVMGRIRHPRTGDTRTHLRAFSLGGRQLWTLEIKKPHWWQPPAAGPKGRVYLIADNKLILIRAGKQIWAVKLKSKAKSLITITANNHAVVQNGPYLCIYSPSGKSLLEKRITSNPKETFHTPVVVGADGSLYIASSLRLYRYH